MKPRIARTTRIPEFFIRAIHVIRRLKTPVNPRLPSQRMDRHARTIQEPCSEVILVPACLSDRYFFSASFSCFSERGAGIRRSRTHFSLATGIVNFEGRRIDARSSAGRSASGRHRRRDGPDARRSSWIRLPLRTVPKLVSRFSVIAPFFSGSKKLGQPVPESNLCTEAKRGLAVDHIDVKAGFTVVVLQKAL